MKRQLPKEMSQGKSKEANKLREEVMPTPKKTKFGRKTIDDDESRCGSTEEVVEEMDLRTIIMGTIPISLECSTSFLILSNFFKSKQMEKSQIKIKVEK